MNALEWVLQTGGPFVFYDLLTQLHLHTLRQQIGMVFMVGVVIYAFLKGEQPERTGGLVMLAAWIITPFTQGLQTPNGLQFGIFVIDVMLLIFLVTMALQSKRFWPLWAAAFHLLGVLMHLAITIDPSVRTKAYITGSVICGYLTVLTLVAGVLLEANRRPSLRGTA